MSPATPRGLLVVGSVNRDRFFSVPELPAPGVTVAAGAVSGSLGGKGANQAVAAARLGAPVRLVGAVGSDDAGSSARAELARQGVDVDRLAVRTRSRTGEAFVFVDQEGENTIVIVAGANAALGEEDVPAELFDGAEAVTLSFEISEATVRRAAHRARRAGAAVVLNPSPYRTIPPELLADVSVLVVNEHELRAIVGGAIPTAPSEPDLADALATLEVPRVVVTLGGRGALSRDDDGTVRRHPAPVVDAVDTTGCGDAFLGALAAGLLGGGGFCDAVDTAVVVGAFAATRSGAQPSYPTREELDSWPRP